MSLFIITVITINLLFMVDSDWKGTWRTSQEIQILQQTKQ